MKNKLTYSFLLLVIASILFSNCSIQKRKFRSGFYLVIRKNSVPPYKSGQNSTARVTLIRNQPNKQRKVAKVFVKQEMGLTASTEKSCREHMQKSSIRPLPMVEDSCGDKVVFLNGEEVWAKVIEVGITNIKYKTCDNLSGPTIIRSKEKTFMIKYKNGSKEVFKNQNKALAQSVQPVPVYTHRKKLNGLSLSAFIVSLFSWTIVLAPVALALGIAGKNKVKANPDTLKGEGFASAAIAISTTVLMFVAALLIVAVLV